MTKTNKPQFRVSFVVDVTNIKSPIHVVADSFGECACKVHKFINSLETKESHEIISITRNVRDILV